MQLARVNIIEPNGVKRSVALGSNRPLTIGRDPECDIAIGYERASRHHAQIAFDGQRYFIIDLNSTNGTYLGNTRLTPNFPTEWFPNVSARIGDIYFQLEMQSSSASHGPEGHPQQAGAAPGFAPTENQSSNTLVQIVGVLFLAMLSVCCCAGLGTLLYFSASY